MCSVAGYKPQPWKHASVRARLIADMARRVFRRLLAIALLPASAALALAALPAGQPHVAAATPPPIPGQPYVPQCPQPPLLPRCQPIPRISGLPIVRPTPAPVAANRGTSNGGVAGLGAPNEHTPSATLSDEQRQASFLAAEHAATQAKLSPSIPLAVSAGTAAGAVVLFVLIPAALLWRRRRASS